MLPWYSTSPLLKSTNHALVLIIHLIWMVFLISCDRLTVFHLIDRCTHFPRPTALHSARYLSTGTPPVDSGSSKSTWAVLEYGCTWVMDGAEGTSAPQGDTSQYAVGQLHFNSLCPIIWPDCMALCFSNTFIRGNWSYCIAIYWTKSTIAGNSKVQYITKAKRTQTLNVNVIFYCHKWLCVCFEINTEKQTSWDHDELFGFGPDLIGGRTVVVAKVALRLWIDLGQFKRMH